MTPTRRLALLQGMHLAALLLVCGCAAGLAPGRAGGLELEFLTRTGCAQSEPLAEQLLRARATLGFDLRLVTVDAAALPADDYRTGYGTPSLLIDGEDLFGAPRPEPAELT